MPLPINGYNETFKAFATSEAALQSYLDKQLESGAILPVERQALGH